MRLRSIRPLFRSLIFALLVGAGAPALLAREPASTPQIALQGYRFDPLAGTPSLDATLAATADPAHPALYLVQFAGPVEESWKSAVVAAGASLYGYVPEHAFIARMDGATANTVARLPHVRWVGPYQPAYRLDPALNAPALAAAPAELPPLSVQTLPDADLDRLAAQILALGGSVESRALNPLAGYLVVHVPAGALAALAGLDGVLWVEPRGEVGKLNDMGGPGVIGVDQARQRLGLYGAGQIVGVADTGLDVGDPARLHPDVRGRLVRAYCLGRPQPCDYSDYDGHGTHVLGSVLGNGALSGSNPAAHQYAGSYAGSAPEARYVFQSTVGTNGIWTGLPADFGDLMRQAYADGARIHTNSWGGPTGVSNGQRTYGAYTAGGQQVDLAAWQHKDMLILFAAGNEGQDTDGDGVIDQDSMANPGTAKNVITVGASENLRPNVVATWGQRYGAPIASDRKADNINGTAAFSSRGPTDDGRIKPDLAAPGTYVASVRSQQFMLDTDFESGTDAYAIDWHANGGTATWKIGGSAHSGAGAFRQLAAGAFNPGAASLLLTPAFNAAAGSGFEVSFFQRYRLSGDDRLRVYFIGQSTQNPQQTAQISLPLNYTGTQTGYAPVSLVLSAAELAQHGIDAGHLRIGFALTSGDSNYDSEWAIDDLRVDGAQWSAMSAVGLAQPGDAIDENYHLMGGTSMATPLTAGTAALLREWLTRYKGVAAPSGALMKALLINGAADMGAGQYGTGAQREIPAGPNSVSGWGRVDLPGTILPGDGQATWFADHSAGVATGGTVSYRLVVGANGEIVAEAVAPAATPPAGVTQASAPAACGLECISIGQSSALPLGAPALNAASQLLANPGFESTGWAPWNTAGRPALDSTYRHGGVRSALLGGIDGADDRIGQTVSIPAGASAISFGGWISSATNEVFFGSDSICIGMWLTDSTPVHDPLCADIADLGDSDWKSFSYTLSAAEIAAAAGKQVVFGAVLSNDDSLGSTIWLDDLALNVTAPNVTATPRPTTPTVTPPDSGSPLRLTLAWTDYPGQPMAARALVNDLDLEVIGPDGARYFGNADAYPDGHSCLEQGRDRCNNVEGVRIPVAKPGVYTVIVRGAQVAEAGKQPFALAGVGAGLHLEGTSVPTTPPTKTATATASPLPASQQRIFLPLITR